MRLYSRTGLTVLTDPVYGQFQAGADGGFDFPEELSEQLHGFHVGARPMWETDIERQHRLIAEELERRKDPATLLSVVEQLMAQATAAPQAPAEPATAKPRARKAAAKAPAAE